MKFAKVEQKGHKLIPQGKSQCSNKGGLVIYLHETFDYEYKFKVNKYKTCEGQIIQVKKGDNLTKPIIIGNINRPPNELVDFYNEFISELSSVLKSLEKNKCEVIASVDFNIDLLKINNKQVFRDYFDMLTNNSFYPKITLPTRLSNKHGTRIDNLFCKLTETTLDTISGILIKKFSDHQPYFTILKTINHKDHKPKYTKIVKQDMESIQNFHDEIQNALDHANLNNRLLKIQLVMHLLCLQNVVNRTKFIENEIYMQGSSTTWAIKVVWLQTIFVSMAIILYTLSINQK